MWTMCPVQPVPYDISAIFDNNCVNQFYHCNLQYQCFFTWQCYCLHMPPLPFLLLSLYLYIVIAGCSLVYSFCYSGNHPTLQGRTLPMVAGPRRWRFAFWKAKDSLCVCWQEGKWCPAWSECYTLVNMRSEPLCSFHGGALQSSGSESEPPPSWVTLLFATNPPFHWFVSPPSHCLRFSKTWAFQSDLDNIWPSTHLFSAKPVFILLIKTIDLVSLLSLLSLLSYILGVQSLFHSI